MKYAVFTFEGNGFPIAEHLLQERQEVLVGQVENFADTLTQEEEKMNLLESKEESDLRLKRYNNILSKMPAKKLLDHLKKVTDPENYFLFFDSNNLFQYAQQLQQLGFHGNFPTEEDREFEVNRDKAKEFVKKYYPKIKIAEKKTYSSITEAETFLKTSNIIWVLKSQTDRIPTFVPETGNIDIAREQIVEMLNVFKEGYEDSGFFLERKIQSAIEITPEKFYYDGKPLITTINLENKFIGSGNLSMQVGCAGDLVFPTPMGSRINEIAFPPIVDELAKKHKGLFIWDASLLIDPATENIYFGEFCPNRPGYNSFFTEAEQASSLHEFFEQIVAGKNPIPTKSVGASLMLFNILRDAKDNLMGDASITALPEIQKHTWPYDIYKKSPKDSLRTVGYDLHLSPITAHGESVQEAVDNLYKHIEGFIMTRLYYRPKFDFLSNDYSSSILNRLQYCMDKQLFHPTFSL